MLKDDLMALILQWIKTTIGQHFETFILMHGRKYFRMNGGRHFMNSKYFDSNGRDDAIQDLRGTKYTSLQHLFLLLIQLL